jgi:hypothetical protein
MAGVTHPEARQTQWHTRPQSLIPSWALSTFSGNSCFPCKLLEVSFYRRDRARDWGLVDGSGSITEGADSWISIQDWLHKFIHVDVIRILRYHIKKVTNAFYIFPHI